MRLFSPHLRCDICGSRCRTLTETNAPESQDHQAPKKKWLCRTCLLSGLDAFNVTRVTE